MARAMQKANTRTGVAANSQSNDCNVCARASLRIAPEGFGKHQGQTAKQQNHCRSQEKNRIVDVQAQHFDIVLPDFIIAVIFAVRRRDVFCVRHANP